MYLNKITNETFYSPQEVVVDGVRYPKQVFDNVETLNSLNVFELTEEPLPDGRLYSYIEEVDAVNLILKRTPIPKTDVELLAVAKEEKLGQIETDYTLAELEATSCLGFNFTSGTESIVSIDGYVRLNRIAGITTHKIWDINGHEHSLTDTEVDTLLLAIGSKASINKFNKKNRKLALSIASTIAEVEAI